jgi:hypothetical protein
MFALPFFFLIPGIVLVLGGGLLVFFTRLRADTPQAEKTKANSG